MISNDIEIKGSTKISELLMVNTTLIEVDLSCNYIYISMIWIGLECLLILSGNNIGDNGIALISQSLMNNNSLTELNLTGKELKYKKLYRDNDCYLKECNIRKEGALKVSELLTVNNKYYLDQYEYIILMYIIGSFHFLVNYSIIF